MGERNVLMASTTVILSPLVEFYDKMLPWIMLAAVLIVVDCRFGVKAAVVRKEKIRISRMWRRSLNKLVDYVCWVTLAGLCTQSFGAALGVPMVSMALLFVVYGIEISSCVNNYFEYKGIRKRLNFWKLVNRPEIEEALEDTNKEGQRL